MPLLEHNLMCTSGLYTFGVVALQCCIDFEDNLAEQGSMFKSSNTNVILMAHDHHD